MLAEADRCEPLGYHQILTNGSYYRFTWRQREWQRIVKIANSESGGRKYGSIRR
jgi:hypothetical protein